MQRCEVMSVTDEHWLSLSWARVESPTSRKKARNGAPASVFDANLRELTSPQHLQRTDCHLHRPIVPAAWRHNLARPVFIVRTSHLAPSLAILLPHRLSQSTRPEEQRRAFL